MPIEIRPTDALILIDMQIDFLPGGALAVPGGDEIIPDLNQLADRFNHVLLTQDWHTPGHISFASTHHKQPFTDTIEAPYGTQHLWPDHCIQNTHGAQLHPGLDIPHAELILRKGFRRDIDSYSAFLENDGATPTGLAGYLRERNLQRLFFTGVAFDFCVGFSALDGHRLGFETIVLEDLTRAVSLPGSVDQTNASLAQQGIQSILSTEIA